MDECLDQEQAVLYPPPPGQGPQADSVLSTAITHAHRELAASDARLKVVSLPLREGDKVVGVITLESTAEGPADIASIELVQAALDLLSPVLIVKRSDDRPLPVRAGVSAAKAGKWLVGPKHTGWKLAGLALFVVLVATVVVSIPYRVEAPMELQPRTKFTVAVPFDGVIGSVPKGAEAGRTVHKGDVLVEMDTTELSLQVLHGQAELDQALKERDEAQKVGKLSEAAQAQAKADQARATLEQAKYNVSRAKILSPCDGMIIAGDLSDKAGAAAKTGEMLFQVAPLDDMLVVARVSDRDIGLVHAGAIGTEEEPTTGDVATKAFPAITFPFTVERVVPLAQPKDGKNAFEVRAALQGKASWLKPGLEGYAHFNTGKHSLMWIGTRRIRDQLRLWLWW